MEVRAGVWFSRRDSAMDGGQPHACLARRSPRSLGSVVRTSSQMRRSDPRWRGAPPPRRTAPSDPGWAFHGPAVMRAATCHRQVGRASPSKGTSRSGSPLRGIAANGEGVFARCREATSRSALPLGGAAAGGARRGGSARTADPAVTGQDVPSRRPRARRQPPGLRPAGRWAGAPPWGVLSLVPFSGQAEKGTRAIRQRSFASAMLEGAERLLGGSFSHPRVAACGRHFTV